MRYFLFFLCLSIFFQFILSCARPERPLLPEKISKDFPTALESQAMKPEGLKASCYIGLKINGEKKPKVKGLIYWKRTDQGLKVRITGMNILGGAIFDFISIDGSLYLYVSGHGTLYYADRFDKLSENKMAFEAEKDALCILSPWSVSLSKDFSKSPCTERGSGDRSCFSFYDNSGEGMVAFDSHTLSPLYLSLKDLHVRYEEPVRLEDGSPYPTSLSLSLENYPFQMDVKLKKISILKKKDSEEVFNLKIFDKIPAAPLSVLLKNFRGQGG